jgi:hypothetical protein
MSDLHHAAAGSFGAAKWLGAMVALALAGCGGPDVQLVEGIVTLDGTPLAAATVCFTPLGGGLPAAGMTDATGRFRLSATVGKKYGGGTTPGEYRVTVEKLVRAGSPEAIAAEAAGWKLLPSDGDIRRLTPAEYANSARSPLRADVKQGRNTFDFALFQESK